MSTRIETIAALLMIGAALAATPALAGNSMPGNRGPAEAPVNRDAPLALPGLVAAGATPHLDRALLDRGLFDADPAEALLGLATLTLGTDGDVSETPASDALRGIFEDAVRGGRSSI